MRAGEAKAICTAAEYALIREAAPPHIATHTPSKLRGFVSRSRRLRDKYRDLANRQRREARGKSAPRGANPSGRNENTLKKVKLFEQALARFEAKLKKLTAKPAAKASKSPASKPAAAKAAPTATKSRPNTALRTGGRAGTIASAAGSAPVVGASVDTAGLVVGRQKALKSTTRRADASRRANILAGTANARIRGHAKGEHARAQAKRDAKNAKD